MYNHSHSHPTAQLEIEVVTSCPFCDYADEDLWVNHAASSVHRGGYGCRSCGQPKLVCPSGAYALSTRMLTVGAKAALRQYNKGNGNIELEVLDIKAALELRTALTHALLRCGV